MELNIQKKTLNTLGSERAVYIIDGLFNEDEVSALFDSAMKSTYTLNAEWATNNTDKVKFISGRDNLEFQGSTTFSKFKDAALKTFGRFNLQLKPYDVSVNCTNPGDTPYEHRDGFCKDVLDLTFILYINTTWDRNWGGETVYYTDSGEVAFSVLPKPGRLVIHECILNHASRAPSIDMLAGQPHRFTLAAKCTNNMKYYNFKCEGDCV
jgi:hypothetical protein